jgi:hypothetical protein
MNSGTLRINFVYHFSGYSLNLRLGSTQFESTLSYPVTYDFHVFSFYLSGECRASATFI